MRLNLEPYEELVKNILDEYHQRVEEMGPPPVGFCYVMGEPIIWKKGDKYEVTITIELARI